MIFLADMLAKVEEYLVTTNELKDSTGYKFNRSSYNKKDRVVKTNYNKYRKAIVEDDEQEVIDEYFKSFEDAASNRDEEGEEEDGYLSSLRIIQGGEELKLLLIVFNKSKKKNYNKAVFTFMKAVKTFAGDFNKGHGVHELTNALGIRALGQRQKIYDIVIAGCGFDPNVTEIKQWWLKCANLLYEISIILKRQDKLYEVDIRNLKRLTANYVNEWKTKLNTYTNKNSIFWKLHMLCCGIIEFVERTGMIGLCSAEGFENKHYVMNQLKVLMAPIAQDKLRCGKLTQRQQSCLIPGLDEVHNFFEEADKKASNGTRGPYKSRGTRTKLLENLPVQEEVEEDAIDGYFVLSKRNLIPDNLAEIYVFMLHGKVPENWSQTFRDSNNLGTKAANAASYAPGFV
jgi:hypothetical protein